MVIGCAYPAHLELDGSWMIWKDNTDELDADILEKRQGQTLSLAEVLVAEVVAGADLLLAKPIQCP
ncbi:hypothetical protein C4D60_Mb07t15710 [Musa balbisiana]|uniref:Uncharacterized protein n=1 Tax=Musa balbisiana TaxID=52838 RepID=A0A4S8JFK4_MUSBA|nr:hypothetical protein C4D60_Mb07t15710 [Musa balbisiana]